MSEWKEYRLADIATLIGDGLHGTPIFDNFGTYYFVNGNNLYQGHIVIKPDTKLVNKEQYELYKKPLSNRTILLSINGTIGNIAKYAGEKCILGKSACFINVTNEVDRDFVYYILCSPKFLFDITNNANGSTIKNVSLKQIREYQIKLPTLVEQQKIAGILSALDEKIETNRKINIRLEELAQAIFKSWFINFEPFGGKMPEDWKRTNIGSLDLEISDFVANGSFASLKENVTLHDKPEFAYFIRNTDLKVNSFSVYVDEHSYNFLSKSRLFGGEIIISNVGDVGSVFLCPSLDKPMTLGNNIIMVRPQKDYLTSYLYLFFQSYIGQHLIDGITGGSAQPKFNKTDFKRSVILSPKEDTLISFELIVRPILKEMEFRMQESVRLAALRDTLLPKLMSGELIPE